MEFEKGRLRILDVLELVFRKGAVKECVAMGHIYCLLLLVALYTEKMVQFLLLNNAPIKCVRDPGEGGKTPRKLTF